VSAHAASVHRPAPSASPIDVHAAPTQDTRKRSGRAGEVMGVIAIPASIRIPIGFGFLL
jgi:hypothetical protein